MHYLDYHARKGSSYLHPGGATGTEELIKALNLKPGMKVLEIGCGTGASIVHITSHFQVECTAADISIPMLNVARQRAKIEGCGQKITFIKLLNDGKLPFADHAFDVIFAESVLGITDSNVLPFLLREISRVLIQGGTFVSNDAIWKDHTSEHDIQRINAACLRDFGIVQSVASPARLKEWEIAFEKAGFCMQKTLKINSQKQGKTVFKKGIFQYYKKITALIDMTLQRQNLHYNKALAKNHQNDHEYLISYMFVAQNQKVKAC